MKAKITQNESETEFHRVQKVSPTQQLLKSDDLLMEPGDVVVTGSVVGSVCSQTSAAKADKLTFC